MTKTLTKLPQRASSFILFFVKEQWLKFTVLILASAIWSTNEAFFPYFLKKIVNTLNHYHGNPHRVYHALEGVLVLLVIFWLVNEFSVRLQGILGIYTFPRFRANIRDAVFNYVKAHSHEYFSSEFAGNIGNKMADLPMSCESVMEIICLQFATTISGVIIVLIMMWLTNPLFAALILAWLCLHLGLTFLLMIYGSPAFESHSRALSALNGKMVDVFTNIFTVRLFARESYEAKYLQKAQNKEIAQATKALWLMETARIGMGLSGLALILGLIFLLIHGWIQGWVSPGDFIQVGMQAFWLMGLVWYVSHQLTLFAHECGTINNALSLIRKQHDVLDQKEAKALIVSEGRIVIDKINFGYQKNRLVFKNFSLEIPAGQKVGLVGFSGSGKSTFVNLLLRFYDLNKGEILIDGQNIAHCTQASLRDQIAMIPQDPTLFHRSLMENIRYGRLEASDQEVIAASQLAHSHEFIEKLEFGYDTLVGERGIKLSGGQRQRIAIARAILKNAPILVLDEATSSLDSMTEQLIQESLDSSMQGRSAIVVAHRLSTLTSMDRILVFHKGSIIEDGSPESLLQAEGAFAKLWNMQTGGFIPDEEE